MATAGLERKEKSAATSKGSAGTASSNGRPTKMIYYFGRTKTEGKGSQKQLLGGKGANLAEMTRLGVPVPPGFTISTAVCGVYQKNGGRIPEAVKRDALAALARVEKVMGRRFGDSDDPLLVSVRSGARASMPGMMDTILNLGLNDATVKGLARRADERFAYDSYRRFLSMYGDVVLEIPHERFESRIEGLMKDAVGVVAMGGYNTFCEILSFDCRAVVAPRTVPRMEQHIRASVAERLGLIRMLDRERDGSGPEVMAGAIRGLAAQTPPSRHAPPGFMDGIDNIIALARSLLGMPVA